MARGAVLSLRTLCLSYGLMSSRRTLSPLLSDAHGGAVSSHLLIGFLCGHICIAAYSSFLGELVVRYPDVCREAGAMLASTPLSGSPAYADAVHVFVLS